ncbi:MAG TPA: transglutaminase family protein, partial [Planctomycetota bacterium]|nr:transglutaminase family protein [Planctomycetota bacterium]
MLLLLLVIVAARAGDAQVTLSELFTRVLKLQHVQEPELDDAVMTAAFLTVVNATHTALAMATTNEERIVALNTTLLANRKVSYLSNQYWRDSTLAASLLRHQGNCLATSTLYVLVGDALGLPIKPVMIPGHAFVRWDDGTLRRNIETADSGEEITDDDYLYRDNPPDPADVATLGWGRSLDHDAFLAELVECAAQHRAGEGRLADAQVLLEEAKRLAP